MWNRLVYSHAVVPVSPTHLFFRLCVKGVGKTLFLTPCDNAYITNNVWLDAPFSLWLFISKVTFTWECGDRRQGTYLLSISPFSTTFYSKQVQLQTPFAIPAFTTLPPPPPLLLPYLLDEDFVFNIIALFNHLGMGKGWMMMTSWICRILYSCSMTTCSKLRSSQPILLVCHKDMQMKMKIGKQSDGNCHRDVTTFTFYLPHSSVKTGSALFIWKFYQKSRFDWIFKYSHRREFMYVKSSMQVMMYSCVNPIFRQLCLA